MSKLSVIIPSRNEPFLQKTIEDLLLKAKGDIEIIVILDGYWTELKNDDRVVIIHRGTSRGMRNGINSAVAIARGDYIMKIDAHCMVDEGFDLKLIEASQPNWIQIPRRKRLDAENWVITETNKIDIDYEFLSFPDDPADFGGPSLTGKKWNERSAQRKDILIDDTPASQGSCWFMEKSYFYELELMDEENYGPFWCESQELAFKCVLSGGRYVVNKHTWYAHLHKGKKHGRGYSMSSSWLTQGRNQTMKYFEGSKVWHKQKYPLSRLIEMHMPMPTWDEDKLNVLKENEKRNFTK